jgi:hypothetical protein
VQEWVFDQDGARTGHEARAGVDPSPPGPPRRRLRRWVAAAGATLAVVATGAAVAAGSASSAPTASAAETQPAQVEPPAVTRGTAPEQPPPDDTTQDDTTTQDDAGAGSALHIEREMTRADGSTVTVGLQSGQVTAVAADSVTVASADGFTRTYAVTADTRIATPTGTLSDLEGGDGVLVEAVIEGDTATATGIGAASGPAGRHDPRAGTSDQEPTSSSDEDGTAGEA